MSLFASLADILYPPACLLCHARFHPWQPAADLFCEACAKALPVNGPPVCTCCGRELPGAFDAVMLCAACRSGAHAFDRARAPWTYTGPMRDAVRQFKYHRRWRIGRWLAREMAAAARRDFPLEELDAVLPVPPHWVKRYARGFNPVGDLARTVSEALGKPCLPAALRRTRWTKTQTRLPSPARARNVQGAFAASHPLAQGRTFLLIDDVLTSGATADACARALKAAGASRVFVLTAAQTPVT